MEKYNNRNEVPEEYKWNLDDFFKNNEEFYKTLEDTKVLIEELKEYKDCIPNAKRIYEFLTKEINATSLCMNLYAYAHLINDQELGISSNIEMENKTLNLYNDLEINTSFFPVELLKLSIT